jgi:hypothetical protein
LITPPPDRSNLLLSNFRLWPVAEMGDAAVAELDGDETLDSNDWGCLHSVNMRGMAMVVRGSGGKDDEVELINSDELAAWLSVNDDEDEIGAGSEDDDAAREAEDDVAAVKLGEAVNDSNEDVPAGR